MFFYDGIHKMILADKILERTIIVFIIELFCWKMAVESTDDSHRISNWIFGSDSYRSVRRFVAWCCIDCNMFVYQRFWSGWPLSLVTVHWCCNTDRYVWCDLNDCREFLVGFQSSHAQWWFVVHWCGFLRGICSPYDGPFFRLGLWFERLLRGLVLCYFWHKF